MDISNRAVNFYTADTGSKINLAGSGENKIYTKDLTAGAYGIAETAAKHAAVKKRRKSRRLNTLDSDFFPDEPKSVQAEEEEKNFFKESAKEPAAEKLKQAADFLFTSVPLINYFYLKNKESKIQNAAAKLNDIIQNTDELLNSAVPYGEDGSYYDSIAKYLTEAANAAHKAERDF